MAKVKLTERKHVRTPPRRNVMPMESHSDGQNAGYFPRTLRTMLLSLGCSEPPLFIGVSRLLHVVEATKPRWTFEGGMREAA
jgi:hypothetical protein